MSVSAPVSGVRPTTHCACLLAAAVDEHARRETGVARVREHRGGLVEGTAEAATDRQETGRERGDEVLAITGRDDGVQGTAQ